MDFTKGKLRNLRLAQLSLLIYYLYFLFKNGIFKALPLLFIFGLLEYVYPSTYSNQSFWQPYKTKTIFFNNMSLVAETVLELTFCIFYGFYSI